MPASKRDEATSTKSDNMPNVLRKHRSQMSWHEVQRIYRRLSEFPCFKLTPHAKAKGVALPLVLKGSLVEFNLHENSAARDARVLLRSKEGVCAVVSLISGRVVTVYRNSTEDNHETLRWSEYDDKLEVNW